MQFYNIKKNGPVIVSNQEDSTYIFVDDALRYSFINFDDCRVSQIEYLVEEDKIIAQYGGEKSGFELIGISSDNSVEKRRVQNSVLRIKEGIYLEPTLARSVNLIDTRKTPFNFLSISQEMQKAFFSHNRFSLYLENICFFTSDELPENMHLITFDIGRDERIYSAISLDESSMFQMVPSVYRLLTKKVYPLANHENLIPFSEFADLFAQTDIVKELAFICEKQEAETIEAQENAKQYFIQYLKEK